MDHLNHNAHCRTDLTQNVAFVIVGGSGNYDIEHCVSIRHVEFLGQLK